MKKLLLSLLLGMAYWSIASAQIPAEVMQAYQTAEQYTQSAQEEVLIKFSGLAHNITFDSEGIFECELYKPSKNSEKIYARGGFSGNLVGIFNQLEVEIVKENNTLLIRAKGIIDFEKQGFPEGAVADFNLHILMADNKTTGVYHIGYIANSYSYKTRIQMGILYFHNM